MIMLKVKENYSLINDNTLKIDAKAKYFIEITTLQELEEFFQSSLSHEKMVILWGGSNILFTKDFDGVVLKMLIKGIQEISNKEEEILVNVSAGETRQDFVEYCGEHWYAGIENLAWIPWNVWTSPVSNIWAYCMEAKDCIVSVEWYDLQTHEKKIFTHEQCQFGYRSSIFKKELSSKFLITSVLFSLHHLHDYEFNLNYPDIQRYLEEHHLSKSELDISLVIKMIIDIRDHKLPNPKGTPNAWSFFANPIIDKNRLSALLDQYPQLKYFPTDQDDKIKLSAWQLIDLAGLKGYSNGKAWTSEKHALILVNPHGTSQDVLEVAHHIQEGVYDKFQISLQPEVVYIQ